MLLLVLMSGLWSHFQQGPSVYSLMRGTQEQKPLNGEEVVLLDDCAHATHYEAKPSSTAEDRTPSLQSK